MNPAMTVSRDDRARFRARMIDTRALTAVQAIPKDESRILLDQALTIILAMACA